MKAAREDVTRCQRGELGDVLGARAGRAEDAAPLRERIGETKPANSKKKRKDPRPQTEILRAVRKNERSNYKRAPAAACTLSAFGNRSVSFDVNGRSP
jgi:hypothetical protein